MWCENIGCTETVVHNSYRLGVCETSGVAVALSLGWVWREKREATFCDVKKVCHCGFFL
jgi:hypothetical protein